MLSLVVALLLVVAIAIGATLLIAIGALTLDTGWGRRTRHLGPQIVRIAAPRQLVFQMASAPYAIDPPRAFRQKVEVLERCSDMVLAAHRSRVGRLTTVTVETVSFEAPERIRFRLIRGPVPFVAERFVLRDVDGTATEIEYTGELGTDGWAVGAGWGKLVARRWERVVARSLVELQSAAEDVASLTPRTAADQADQKE